jgi:hypothetical protein
MSVTFYVSGRSFDPEDPDTYLNLNNRNGDDLLRWLGYTPMYHDELPARELAARCRRRLWNEPHNDDAALPAVDEDGGRLIFCGRAAGYLRERTADLLRLAERAGDGFIKYS